MVFTLNSAYHEGNDLSPRESYSSPIKPCECPNSCWTISADLDEIGCILTDPCATPLPDNVVKKETVSQSPTTSLIIDLSTSPIQ